MAKAGDDEPALSPSLVHAVITLEEARAHVTNRMPEEQEMVFWLAQEDHMYNHRLLEEHRLSEEQISGTWRTTTPS